MPTAKQSSQGGIAGKLAYIFVLFFIALLSSFVIIAGFTFGIGGFFWATLGVIGFIGAIVFVFMLVLGPIILAIVLLQRR